MIMHWQYQALNKQGQEIKGVFQGQKSAALTFINAKEWELIDLKPNIGAYFIQITERKKLSIKSMMVFFEDLRNMYQTGLSLNQIFLSLKDSTQDSLQLHVLETLRESMEQGNSLADAFACTKAFPWIVILTIKSGEQSGTLEDAFVLLAQYFKRQYEIAGKLKEALTYPSILFCLLVGMMLFVGLKVVPQLKTLLPDAATAKGTTAVVIGISLFLQKYFLFVLMLPLIVVVFIIFLIRKYPQSAETILYHLPIYGPIKKETDLAFYFLNLSMLLRNGVPLIKCVDDLNVYNASIVSRHFYKCREYLFGGMPLWESLRMDALFSSVVVFTVRRGEEMARLPQYCSNLSDYFNKRVYERIDQIVILLQPILLMFGGIFLIIIAFAFLVPLYGNLTQIAGG